MEDYNISDSEITASSSQSGYTPEDARLHIGRAWVSYWTEYQWIQIRFLRQIPITGVITQGESGENAWVKTYKFKYSLDNQDWKYVLDKSGEDQVSSVKEEACFCPVFGTKL